jgi:hypothetical protein
MALEHIAPYQFKTGPQQVEIARRGGSVTGSKRKSASAKLNNYLRLMKKEGLSEKNKEKMFLLITDPVYSEMDMALNVKKIQSLAVTPQDHIQAERLQMELHKMLHGSKAGPNTVVAMQQNNYSDNGKPDISELWVQLYKDAERLDELDDDDDIIDVEAEHEEEK